MLFADQSISSGSRLPDSCRIHSSLECITPPPIVSGCTDPAALNYNPLATLSDGSCFYPPANDDCANATSFTLTCGSSYTDAGSTANANNVGNGPTCTTTASTAGGVWYQFVGTGNDVTASLCGSAYDTKIFAYTGTCGAFTCEGGNDDACGVQSEITIPTSQGVTYTILLQGGQLLLETIH